MKRKLALLLTIIMVLSMTACGAEKADTSAEANGGAVATEGDTSTTDANVEENAEGVTELGLRNPEYQAINAAGTDTDKLAFLVEKSVFVLDFGTGSGVVSDLGIDDNMHVFITLTQGADIFLHLNEYGGDDIPWFVFNTPEFEVSLRGIEKKSEIFIGDEDETVTAEDGSYTIVYDPNGEGRYSALITLAEGGHNVIFKMSKCDSLDEAKAVVSYMQNNLKYYDLDAKNDISTAKDHEGNSVDLSSYIFYRDVLAKALAEKFGINVKSPERIVSAGITNYEIEGEYKWELSVDAGRYNIDTVETDPVDFMGYTAYVIPGEKVYLLHGGDDCVEITPHFRGDETPTTVEDTLKAMEQALFSNNMEE